MCESGYENESRIYVAARIFQRWEYSEENPAHPLALGVMSLTILCEVIITYADLKMKVLIKSLGFTFDAKERICTRGLQDAVEFSRIASHPPSFCRELNAFLKCP